MPLDIQLGRAVAFNPNVNVDETPERQVQEAAPPKRWYMTEALVKEHGRTTGCSRCTDGTGIHNADCRRRTEGILLQQSRMETKEDEDPQGARTVTRPVPAESEKPTGPAVQHGNGSGSGTQRDTGPSSVSMPTTVEASTESCDVEMGTEELDTTPRKRAKTIMGLEICRLEAGDRHPQAGSGRTPPETQEGPRATMTMCHQK